MLSKEETNFDDKDEMYRQYYDKMQAKYLKTIVCDEIIEEHKNKPLGQHSEALERLLHFFRSAPQKNKYAIKSDNESKKFKIIALSGERGIPPRVIEDEEFETLHDAYHGIFLRRVHELMES